jgi:hypothetical protein
LPGHLLKPDAIVHHHHHATHCLNCDGPVGANFCPQCGQATAAHVPSAREFLHELVGHYVALESKLWRTLALLMFRPGRLTRDYIEGKRVRYVEPLRVYLTLSVLFFALFKWSAHDVSVGPPPAVKWASQAADGGPSPNRAAAATGQAASAKRAAQAAPGMLVIGDQDRKTIQDIFGAKALAKADSFMGKPREQQWQEGEAFFFGYAPYAIFAMMPVFALYLKILYLGSGRLYGEHLLFALHANAFAFLILLLMLALPSFIPWVHTLLGWWLALYLPTAMRKVYGGSRLATCARWIVLMALHLLGMVLMMCGGVWLAMTH